MKEVRFFNEAGSYLGMLWLYGFPRIGQHFYLEDEDGDEVEMEVSYRWIDANNPDTQMTVQLIEV